MSDRAASLAVSGGPSARGDLIVGHLLDVVVKRARSLEERLEVIASPEALQVPFCRVPLDSHDLLLGVVDRAGGVPPQAVRGRIEQLAGTLVGVLELVAAAGLDLVADVLHDHGCLPSLIS